jgi:hypothetical protein
MEQTLQARLAPATFSASVSDDLGGRRRDRRLRDRVWREQGRGPNPGARPARRGSAHVRLPGVVRKLLASRAKSLPPQEAVVQEGGTLARCKSRWRSGVERSCNGRATMGGPLEWQSHECIEREVRSDVGAAVEALSEQGAGRCSRRGRRPAARSWRPCPAWRTAVRRLGRHLGRSGRGCHHGLVGAVAWPRL